MNFIFQLAISFVGISFVVLLLGMLYTYFVNNDNNSFSYNYMTGFVVLFAVFQLATLPAVFLRLSFANSFFINSIVFIVLSLVSFLLNFKRIITIIKTRYTKICHVIQKSYRFIFKSNKEEMKEKVENDVKGFNYPLFLSIVMTIIVIYLYQIVYFGTEFYGDNMYYVGTAVVTLETNTMFQIDPLRALEYPGFPWRYVLAPFPIFWAFLSKLFNVHPAAMALSILPVLLFIFTVCVYFNIGKILFRGDIRKASSFLFFSFIIMIFSPLGQSSGHGLYALLLISQGKALVFVTMIPLCFYFYMRIFWQESKRADWIMLFMLMLASSMVSSMGVTLGALCIGILGVAHLILTKKVKEVVYLAICCIPNIIIALIFILAGDLTFNLYNL